MSHYPKSLEEISDSMQAIFTMSALLDELKYADQFLRSIDSVMQQKLVSASSATTGVFRKINENQSTEAENSITLTVK